MEDRVEVVGALRLPLGGLNGYLGVRGKQGRKQDKYQGTTPNKTRRTKLFLTPRDAAVALAELKERPQVDPDDPIKHIDFSSPAILPAAPAALRLSVLAACGVLPLRPELEPHRQHQLLQQGGLVRPRTQQIHRHPPPARIPLRSEGKLDSSQPSRSVNTGTIENKENRSTAYRDCGSAE